jgi:Spy/CpxP family protein refolding chaperone
LAAIVGQPACAWRIFTAIYRRLTALYTRSAKNGCIVQGVPFRKSRDSKEPEMKSSKSSLIILLAAAAIPLAAAAHAPLGEPFAGDRMPPPPCGAMPMHPGGMENPGHPPSMMPPLPLYLRDVVLNEAQQDKVFSLLLAQAPRQREQAKAAFKTMEELRLLSTSDHFDVVKARGSADAHAHAVADMALLRAELDAGIRALLTPEQRKQIDDGRNRFEGAPNRPHLRP